MQELLKYQDLDNQLRKLSGILNASESRKKANQMQQYLKDSQVKLINLDKASGQVVDLLSKLKQEENAVIEKVEMLLKKEGKISLEDYEITSNDISKLIERLSKIERDLNNVQNKLISINKEFEGLMKNAKTARNNLNIYKQEYDKQKAQYEPQIEKLKQELNEQKKRVKPELLAKYNAKAEGKIFPIFVSLKDNRCSGCRMEVSASKIKDLKNGNFVECENCGRIIYYV